MSSKRLVLDRDHLLAIVGDPAFYSTHEAFSYLQAEGLSAHAQYREDALQSCCGGDWGLIRYVVNTVVHILESQPEVHASIYQYLQTKKGYTIQPIVIFYRDTASGPPKRFEF